MIEDKDIRVLKFLRENSRSSALQISSETDLPIKTVLDSISKMEKGLIKRYVSLIDFKKAGYKIRTVFFLNGDERLMRFLSGNCSVNSLSILKGDHSFFAECVFRDEGELSGFRNKLKKISKGEATEVRIESEVNSEDFSIPGSWIDYPKHLMAE